MVSQMAENAFTRADGRLPDELRPFSIERGVQPRAYGSLLIKAGGTEVLCAVSIEDAVPSFLDGLNQGWVTAEYAMLPGAVSGRTRREHGGRSGRSMEIQRLIGRSLRMMVDLTALGTHTLRIDCDVLNADGGTRTAAITGAALALRCAIARMVDEMRIIQMPVVVPLAAVSVGIVKQTALLDLSYEEDSAAEADGNFVMRVDGRWIELQATAEGAPLTDGQFSAMHGLARRGIGELLRLWE
jgi:ribonuclease PH